MWIDDTPVTADDYVATFRYAADPKHAWDFTWFFGGVIKNWEDAVAGKMPVDQLGVKAVDAHTLQFETQSPAPYLPAMLLYSWPLQKKALEAHGGLYNSDVATTVSSGPFVLKEWIKGDRLIYEANPKYKGTNKPFIQKIVVDRRGAQHRLCRLSGRRDRLCRLAVICRRPTTTLSAPTPSCRRSSTRTTATSAPTTCSSTPRTRRSTTSRCGRRFSHVDRSRWADQEHYQADPGLSRPTPS